MIHEVDFHEMENQKYWSFPKSYKKDAKAETRNMVFSGDYIGARKMDGAFYKFIKNDDGSMELLGRSRSVSGDFLNKIEYVPQLTPFFEALPNGTCLLGEIYFPKNEGSSNVTTIMGCLKDKAINRQEQGEKLHYYVFDVLAYDGNIYYKDSIMTRLQVLDGIEDWYNNFIKEKCPYVEFAQYYEGAELWEQLQQILEIGGEGVVITKKNTCYQPGKRPARQTLKIKKEIGDTLDVVVLSGIAPSKEYTGKNIETWNLWYNEYTDEKLEGELFKDYNTGSPIIPVTKNFFHDWAGSLQIGVVKDGKLVSIGAISGLTEEILANADKYRGKVMEVSCMEILPTLGLRHPKFIKWRPDLNIEDCTWEKVYGNE